MSKDEADEQADRLSKKYGVKVLPVETDQEYYSDDSLYINARESVFFVSRQDPIRTAEETERLLKYARFRYEYMNAGRQENVTRKAVKIQERIDQIKASYQDTHAGEVPSLNKIAALLKEENVPTPRGTSTNWTATAVKRAMDHASPDRGQGA